MDMQERIDYADEKCGYWKKNGTKANCIGFMLFARGLVPGLNNFRVSDVEGLEGFLEPQILAFPELYDLVIFKWPEHIKRGYWGTEHGGVITRTNPIEMVHLYRGWKVTRDFPVARYLQEVPRDIAVYRRPKLSLVQHHKD